MNSLKHVGNRTVGVLLAVLLTACGGGSTPSLSAPPGDPSPANAPPLVEATPPQQPTSTLGAQLPTPTMTSPLAATPAAASAPPPTPVSTLVPSATPTVVVTVPPTPTPKPTPTPAPTATPVPPPPPPPAVTPTRVPPPTSTARKATATATTVATAAPPPPIAPNAGPARVITRGNTTRRMVALTFDAGADRGNAAAILNTLRATGVKASFGMTGHWAEQNPDLVARMAAEGHQLINHTYDHASFTGYSPGTPPLTAAQRQREIERAETIIQGVAGVAAKPYFRPPYGDYDAAMLAQLGQLGYTYSVMWTVDSLGWNGYSAARIVDRCVAGAAPGAILLFHVGSDSQDAAALPEIIRQLRAAGYSFGTVADVLAP